MIMKKQNVAVVLLFSALCLCGLSGSAAIKTNVWNFSGTGGTVTNAADYFDAANWVGGAVGEGADVKVDFSGAQGLKFIKLNRDVAVYQMCGKNEAFTLDTVNRTILVGDHTVTVSRYDNPLSAVQLYAPVYTAYNIPYLQKTIFCGDLTSFDNGVWVNTGSMSFHLDLYANEAGESRIDPLPTGTYRFSWGDTRVYAPQSSPVDVSGTWSQTANSPYVFPKEAEHVISAGTVVSGEGIPEGTFVKRIFHDRSVELSNAATLTIEENVLTFAAFTPRIIQKIGHLQRSAAGSEMMKLMKYREEDVMRFEVRNMQNNDSGVYSFDTVSGYVPGTFVLSPLTVTLPKIAFGTCHIEFAPSENGAKIPGIPNITVRQLGDASVSRLTVTNNVSAVLGGVSNLVGKIVKDGLGELAFPICRGTKDYSGTIEVKEGCLKLNETADGEPIAVGTLALSNNTTLKLPDSGLKVSSANFESGAIVSGGLLFVPNGADLSGVTFVNGASVRFEGAEDTVVLEAPDGEIVGNPAFHVDVMNTESMELVEINGTNFVKRINDVRGAEYGFATNVVLMPYIQEDVSDNTKFIFMPYTSAAADPAETPCLVWDKVIKNIKAAFVVQDCGWDGSKRVDGGQFLGKTYRIPGGGGDFMRADGFTQIFYDTSAARTGEFYINGERRNPDDGYLYQGFNGYGGNHYTPQVTDVQHVKGATWSADSFGCNTGAKWRNGDHRLCECIIYTNALTRLEQLKIRAYLTKKWINAQVNIVPGPLGGNRIDAHDTTGGAAVDVADGQSVWIEATTGDGALRKAGSGTLYVKEVSEPLESVTVAGGKMVLRSGIAPSDFRAESAYVHFDATRSDTFTLGDDGVSVKSWRSISEGGVAANILSGMTNFPTVANVQIGSLTRPVVDFGPFMKLEGDASPAKLKKATVLEFSQPKRLLRTVIGVFGSRNGGGQLVGSLGGGYNDNWGLTRGGTFGASKDDPIFRNDGWHAQISKTDVTYVRTNGVLASRGDGFSGGYDIIALNTYLEFGARGFAGAHYNYYTGGQEIGEYLIWDERLSDERVKMAEAYLKNKWFGEEIPGYRKAKAQTLEVASGAELEILGDALTVGRLSGGGTVTGALALAEDLELEVVVGEDGTVPVLALNGGGVWPQTGCVKMTGHLECLANGTYPIVVSSVFEGLSLEGWTVETETPVRKLLTLRVAGGAAELVVSDRGMTILVR